MEVKILVRWMETVRSIIAVKKHGKVNGARDAGDSENCGSRGV